MTKLNKDVVKVVDVIICDVCHQEIDYEKVIDPILTIGGRSVDLNKLSAVPVGNFDFHILCLEKHMTDVVKDLEKKKVAENNNAE